MNLFVFIYVSPTQNLGKIVTGSVTMLYRTCVDALS